MPEPSSGKLQENDRAIPRVAGLDSLRIILALWVVFGHFGFVPVQALANATGGLPLILRGLYNNLFCGPAAVIAFFVISGFCIHYQYHDRAIQSLRAYYVRRYLRIGIPMLAAMVLYISVHASLRKIDHSIFWSLICEEIYYLIYPLLLRARRRVSWRLMILTSYAVSYAVVATNPLAGDYPSYGITGNWLLGFPCWLLGCHLAERCRTTAPGTTRSIWSWRLAAWALASLASILRFHTAIGYPWTLNVLALFAYLWLEREIVYRRSVQPWIWAERAGLTSYSLYLIHPLGAFLIWRVAFANITPLLSWLTLCVIMLSTSLAFFWLVERPAYPWACRAGRNLMSADRQVP